MKYLRNKRLLFLCATIAVGLGVGTLLAVALRPEPKPQAVAITPAHRANAPQKAAATPTESPAAVQGESTAPAPAPKPAPTPAPAPAPTPSALTTQPLGNFMNRPPTGGPMRVTNVTVSLGAPVCNSLGFGYSFAIDFNADHTGGTLIGNWEYVSGDGGYGVVVPNETITPRTRSIMQIITDADRVMQSLAGPYQARLHITSPNDIYSNWMQVPSASPC